MGGKRNSAADESLPKSGGRGRRAGQVPTEAQRKANEKARAAAAESKKRKAAERREAKALARANGDTIEAKPRWKQLEDGDITVADLTQRELYSRACANNDGTWDGKRHPLPSRIVSQMEAEFVRRMRRNMSKLVGPAFKAMRARLDDDESPAQQFAAAKLVLEYGMGKVPEVVHIGAETAYDRLQQSAFTVMRGGDLKSELEQMGQEPMPGLDNTGHDVVPGELESSDG